jgi:flagellar hook-basal body complex protein FliE
LEKKQTKYEQDQRQNQKLFQQKRSFEEFNEKKLQLLGKKQKKQEKRQLYQIRGRISDFRPVITQEAEMKASFRCISSCHQKVYPRISSLLPMSSPSFGRRIIIDSSSPGKDT